MRGTLHISYSERGYVWWIALGYGISIDQHNYSYKTIQAARRAAVRFVMKLELELDREEIHEEV